jgi:predicted double-glycine peptidase
MISDLASEIVVLLFFWALLPLLAMLLISGTALLFKGTDLPLRRVMKVFLGMGRQRDDDIIRQVRSFDCGAALLDNVLKGFGIANNDVRFPEPSSMLDLSDAAIRHGCSTDGYDNASLSLVEAVLQKNGKVLTLLKIFYPFEGWWVKLTGGLLKFFSGNAHAYHWIMVEKLTGEYIYLIDPYFGRIVLRMSSFATCWTKSMLAIYYIKGGLQLNEQRATKSR